MQLSQELEDLVCLMSRAHRAGQRYNGKGAGEFVWLSYTPRTGRGRRESPSFGSHLFAFTRTFAIEFLNHLWTVKPDHADLVLRAWLIDNAARVGASYSLSCLWCVRDPRKWVPTRIECARNHIWCKLGRQWFPWRRRSSVPPTMEAE